MDDLLDPLSENLKKTIKFKNRNGAALTLLWSSVSTKFEGVLLNNKSSFYNCWVGLGNCCGKNSVVVICRTLQKLVNLRYKHGSSLEKHINDFHKIHASYLSFSAGSSISMSLSPSMAAAFFLQSLDNDKELSSLCQTLYDTKPFELSTITDRVSIEHTRRELSNDQALLFDKNKHPGPPKGKGNNKSEAGRKKTGPQDKKKGKSNNQGTAKTSTQDQNTNKSSDPDAFIFDEVNALIGKNNQELIYLDSGAGRTVVNNLELLENPVPVTKHINTFSNPVKVTHQGTLLFKGINLYPVYYVPNGPVNLLSVSQLCDHRLKLISKSNLFLIKYNNRIVDTFHQQGNLFVSRLSSPVNSIYAFPIACEDWHLTLGHPSDSYIKALLKDCKINGKFTHSSDCPVCDQAKIKNRPHSQFWPCADAPFSKIYMDTLQINPQSRKGYKPAHPPTATGSTRNYEYVPYYKDAPRNISSSINEEEIIVGKRKSQNRENFLLADVVPYSKAVTDPIEGPKWKKPMDAEYQSLTSHNTGELVPYPTKTTKVIGGMWQLSQKRNEHGEVYRHKARWVVLGNHQEQMLHSYNTWASVRRNEKFKIMLSLVINFNYIPYQFDIETAFLHGEMDSLVYVKQVKGYDIKGKEDWVWRLRKSLYGTKQAPQMWEAKLTATLSRLGLASAQSDKSLFISTNKTLLLHVHVDDGFLISKTERTIINFLTKLNSTLKLKYKRKPTQHLGYNLNWGKNVLNINQTDLIIKLLRHCGMDKCKSVKTPCNGNFLSKIGSNLSEEALEVTLFQQAIGSLNYLAHHTRPDILFTTNQLSKNSLKPNQYHWSALKHLLRYLSGTKDRCLVYKQQLIKEALTGWADADYSNNKEDRKSITGYVFLAFGNPVCWLSKKQLIVAQSTTEAEYAEMNICSKQLQWLTFVLNDLGHSSSLPVLFNDNLGAGTISKQASLNANMKHIGVGYQYVRDCVLRSLIKVVQVSTNDMIADVLTKPFGVLKLQEAYKQLRLEDPGGV
ncbi:hypothetical protein O181_056342 [Austropuccinia psidii MF-1]|uniref:Reverse transcriptase Ty1/copia-type domain-containing protein n=1 Tax=Austropuccinia psidii MF-1 TaxID=1389203 RepID=A0A9Q3HUC3_9BASI|nr:hypothetical protein [Austropuccinia psidii MF-1]